MEKHSPDVWFIAIGASGGEGLDNIRSLLHGLGRAEDAIVLVVLHRRFDLPSKLRDVLQMATAMPVIIATGHEKLEPGRVYIGEPSAHLTLLAHVRGGITEDLQQRYRNRTVDLLFASVARHAGKRGIGIVLAGHLDDGSRGLKAIHEAGGRTMVILRGPAARGMPENAIAFDGPIDTIGPTDQIAAEILAAIAGEREGHAA